MIDLGSYVHELRYRVHELEPAFRVVDSTIAKNPYDFGDLVRVRVRYEVDGRTLFFSRRVQGGEDVRRSLPGEVVAALREKLGLAKVPPSVEQGAPQPDGVELYD